MRLRKLRVSGVFLQLGDLGTGRLFLNWSTALLKMALFYLHLCDGEGVIEDEDGEECSDITAACGIAVKSLREVSADEVRRGIIYTASFIEIEDVQHQHIATVRFDDAVEISSKVEREPRSLR